jgi:hypothetical protein
MEAEENRTKREEAERLAQEEEEDSGDKKKEASVMEKATPAQAREAVQAEGMNKEALEARVKAFDFGVDALCEQEGISKQAFAEAYGLQSADELTPAMITCLNAQLAEEQK